jgi:arylsulfatase A-like enzyme
LRAIFVLFDTLNARYLAPYGGTEVPTPNFRRLAERSVTFDTHYVGSLPCMPARRDLMTGRLNFLHRSWGPLEPFDHALPELLKTRGVYSHLITDHYHYFEDGGAGYHSRYHSFDYVRGQEGDGWKPIVSPPVEQWRRDYHPAQFSDRPGDIPYHYMANRPAIVTEAEFPSTQCFTLAEQFLDINHTADNWFLQLETFDPHEPFHAPERHRAAFPTDYDGPIRDWPPYARVTEDQAEQDELRANYKALLAHCDEQLGRLLDKMDALDMWKDTMLIVSTDHGYLMGEHDWWAKNRQPCYEEIAHIPLFLHHPGHSEAAGSRRSALTQTPDLMPTLLEAFGVAIPAEVTARSLLAAVSNPEAAIHDWVLFGYFGGAVNMTDGRTSYFRYPEEILSQALYQYTLMPAHMRRPFTLEELSAAELVENLTYARGVPVLRVPVISASPWYKSHGPAVMEDVKTVAYDIVADPEQTTPLADKEILYALSIQLTSLLVRNNAPPEVIQRLGLSKPAKD